MATLVTVDNGACDSMLSPVYMDYNATTPLAEEVVTVISEALRLAWGNPSSSHPQGIIAKRLIDEARMNVAKMIGANPEDILFTSGGTESNNHVIHSVIESFNSALNAASKDMGPMGEQINRPHVISSNQEHDSILKVLEHLEKTHKIDVTFLPSDQNTGQVLVESVVGAIRPSTCLVTIMLANNETGIIQPIKKIGQKLSLINKSRRSGSGLLQPVLLHSDSAQAIGKIPVDVNELCVDYLTIVGHKFYGPRIGALYIRRPNIETPLLPMLHGGGQERNLRSGTENTPMIVGLGKACELVKHNIGMYEAHMRSVRDYLEEQLKALFGENRIHFNGKFDGVKRLPNTCNVSILGHNGSEILSEARMVHASVGAACHSSKKPSSILLSIGIPEDIARCAIRLSVGRETSMRDIDIVVSELYRVVDSRNIRQTA